MNVSSYYKPISFPYMECKRLNVMVLESDPVICQICGNEALSFELNHWKVSDIVEYDQAVNPPRQNIEDVDDDDYEVDDEDREPFYGCVECLAAQKFNFVHDTEFGLLRRATQPNAQLSQAMIDGMLRTPRYSSCYGAHCETHCGDFMTYVGQWHPMDFVNAAPDGNGKALFANVISEPGSVMLHYKLERYPAHPTPEDKWAFPVHVFRCRHCGAIRAYDELD